MSLLDQPAPTALRSRTIFELETPRLLLDRARLEQNCATMRERCRQLGVALRPHLKTAKSLDVARVATAGEPLGITVSTLKEAEYFARAGYRDILYAVGIAPNKLAQVRRIGDETGAEIALITDSLEAVEAAERFASANRAAFSFLVEIDSGEHRSGVAASDTAVVNIARAIDRAKHLRLRGVLTHAGHSYGTANLDEVRRVAATERDAAVGAANAIRAAGLLCEIVSIGSTPTVLFADHLQGVTEVRAGIYMLWDLSQASRNVCRLEDIAVSVLASVIGHNRAARRIILDAGTLALSKDLGAAAHWPHVGYGLVCDPRTGVPLGNLSVSILHQEHGTVPVDDEAWFERLPVGSLVRVLPNHACITCAAYDGYEVVEEERCLERWDRVNGW